MPRAGIEPARLAAADFESAASTNFTTEASVAFKASAGGPGNATRIITDLTCARKPERRSSRFFAVGARLSAACRIGQTWPGDGDNLLLSTADQ